MDFGLAARSEEGEERLTQEGVAMGTPAYMAPEQAKGEQDKVGPASDQYALGCTLYEMLTGRTPFAGPADVQMFLHQTKDAPAAAKREPGRAARPGDGRAQKCLEKEPAERYATCRALADDLRRWQDGEPIAARRLSTAERFGRWCQRNPAVAGLLAAVVARTTSGATSGIVIGTRDERSPRC